MGSHNIDSPNWEHCRHNSGLTIEDYVWLGYEKAQARLKFENDHAILDKAAEYIRKNNIKG